MQVVPVEEQLAYGEVVRVVTEQPAPVSGVVVGLLTAQPGASSGGAARGVVDQTLAMLDGLADEGGRGGRGPRRPRRGPVGRAPAAAGAGGPLHRPAERRPAEHGRD